MKKILVASLFFVLFSIEVSSTVIVNAAGGSGIPVVRTTSLHEAMDTAHQHTEQCTDNDSHN